MRRIAIRISGVALAAAVGGGLGSALLSMVTAQKTSLALALGCISPLPIMLAALSFGTAPGLLAAAIGAVTIGLFDARQGGGIFLRLDGGSAAGLDVLVYALSLGLPAWWLARLTASTKLGAATVALADQRKLGLMLASTAAFAVVSVALDFGVAIAGHGGVEATVAMMSQRIEPFVQNMLSANRQLPSGVTAHQIAVAMTYAQLPVLAAASFVLLGFNIWAAARITLASGYFRAPWPDLPRSLRVPRPLALLLAASLGLCFAGGMAGLAGLALSGALVVAFATQGLAVVHDVTRGKGYRLPLLIIVYLSLAMLMPWLLAVYALVGLCDAGFSFRDRRKPLLSEKLKNNPKG